MILAKYYIFITAKKEEHFTAQIFFQYLKYNLEIKNRKPKLLKFLSLHLTLKLAGGGGVR